MKIELTEEKLTVGKHTCYDVTITKLPDGTYEASLHRVVGWTYKKISTDSMGNKKSRTLRVSKNIRFKNFEYVGIELKNMGKPSACEKYQKGFHASNTRGNYVNYYER